MDPLEPSETFLGRFEIRAVLGEGGSARVYRAWDTNSKREVALKILTPGERGYAPDTQDRFLREVEVIANLRDPHTVTLFDSGRSPQGLLYLVFEFIGGHDLEELIFRGDPLPESVARHILVQLLFSLREAHAAGLLHRDIKPLNIRVFEYLDDPYHVKLIDFGIARAAEPVQRQITREGALVGTPQFMAPEQITAGPLTPATDIYSLGLVVFEMLTGKRAVDGPTAFAIYADHMSDEPRRLPPDTLVSAELRDVVERMVRRLPEARFQSAEDVLQALGVTGPGAYTTQPQPRAQPVDRGARRPMERATKLEPPEPPPSSDAVAPPKEPTVRNPNTFETAGTRTSVFRDGVMIAVVAAAALGLVFAALSLLSPDDERAPAPTVRESEPISPVADVADSSNAETFVGAAVAAASHGVSRTVEDVVMEVKGGCGLPHPPPSVDDTFRIGNQDRKFRVRVPSNYDPMRQYPVVFLFHNVFNRHNTIDRFAEESGILPVAEANQFLVVSPRSFSQGAGLAELFAEPWSDVPTEVTYVRAVIERLRESHCVDDSRLYALGHGLGSRFLHATQCELPFAAIVTNGHLDFGQGNRCAGERTPLMHLHGRADKVLPIEGTDSNCLGDPQISLAEYTDGWRQLHNCKKGRKPFPLSSSVDCQTFEGCDRPLVVCEHDYGHEWPDSRPVLATDPDCVEPRMKFPAAEVSWQFLSRYIRSSADE